MANHFNFNKRMLLYCIDLPLIVFYFSTHILFLMTLIHKKTQIYNFHMLQFSKCNKLTKKIYKAVTA